jgi:hypothetical protein
MRANCPFARHLVSLCVQQSFLRIGCCLALLVGLYLNVLAQDFAKTSGVQVTTAIAAKPEAVWALLLKFDDYPQWNPFIQSVEGDVKKGKRLHIHISGKTKDYDFKAKVLELNENQAFAWGGSALFFFKARHYFRIEPQGDGTTKLVQGEAWKGWFGKSYGKKVYQEAAENFSRMNLKMKEILEDSH